MSKLRFKKGLPTAPGWYWLRTKRLGFIPGVEVEIVRVRDYAGKLAIMNSTLAGWKQMEEAEWAGPIPQPEDAV